MDNRVNALILGDIIGHPGCRAVFLKLKQLVKDTKADVVIANGENAADGFGITAEIADRLFSIGVDVITTGNHIWQKHEIFQYMKNNRNLIRPANYPPGAPGNGYALLAVKGVTLAVLNLQGRENLSSIDCPFRCARETVKRIEQECQAIIVDFHAESVREKEALAYFLDGTVSAVVGTHTHVQTADERLLPGGTAFISDIGMSGPVDTVIGSDKDLAIQRSLTQMPLKLEIPDKPAIINGVSICIDAVNGKAVSIERIFLQATV